MGTKKKLLFVFNPFSGKAQIKNQLLDIVDVMVKADYEVTIYPTQAQGDAIHKIETEAGDYDLVVCSGGDGTLDEVVTGMMHREKRYRSAILQRAARMILPHRSAFRKYGQGGGDSRCRTGVPVRHRSV